jgi:hypothetical protein
LEMLKMATTYCTRVTDVQDILEQISDTQISHKPSDLPPNGFYRGET